MKGRKNHAKQQQQVHTGVSGCQYSSESYRRMLRENGIRQSMSRTGCPYDNACSESFFATVKKECIYLKEYDTIEEVKRDIYEYIELFYNRKRILCETQGKSVSQTCLTAGRFSCGKPGNNHVKRRMRFTRYAFVPGLYESGRIQAGT